MAINTGPVVVGTIGAALRTDYTAAGNTTSIASRLLRIAEPGQIGELGEMPLPESLETVEVYTLTRETMAYVESGRLAAV